MYGAKALVKDVHIIGGWNNDSYDRLHVKGPRSLKIVSVRTNTPKFDRNTERAVPVYMIGE